MGGSWSQLLALAHHLEATRDPVVRQRLADVYIHHRVRGLVAERVEKSFERLM